MKKWIKFPKPGQFRGEGEWTDIEWTTWTLDDWEHNKLSNYLPWKEQEEKPNAN
jgi:hypothetical protein